LSQARHPTTSVRVIRVRPAGTGERPDTVVTEEPLEIRAAGTGQEPAGVAVTMRTPGHDFELAAGFLYTEGLIDGRPEVATIKYCELPEDQEQRFNVVTVWLTRLWAASGQRAFPATSSCGVCGKSSIDQIEVTCAALPTMPAVPASLIRSLPDRLRARQRLFRQTGGLHAAALFTHTGALTCVREDVGRHNAVDKTIGHALLGDRLPLYDEVLLVSGRLSFEIIQKAARAGVPVVAAVSAPSSLAVAAAGRLGVAVAAFVRDGGFNVYSHPERIDVSR
jgi:FdhD protein